MRIILYFGLITILLSSCDLRNNDNSNELSFPDFSDELFSPLSLVGGKDTLKIIVQSSECGEWGGHQDYLLISTDSKRQITARLTVDTVSCDKIINKNGVGVLDDFQRVIVFDSTKILNDSDEEMLSKMLQRLLELKLRSELHSNHGDNFKVEYTDGSLFFNYWNSGNYYDTYYWKTRMQLFGKIN